MRYIATFFLLFMLTACSAGSVPSNPPTMMPSGTATFTPAPPTSTATPTPVPNGPCDNPLVPLAAGNQWVYRVTTPEGESLYDLKSVEIRQEANMVAVVDFTDHRLNETIQEWVICQEGAIENFPLFVTTMLLSDYVSTTFNTYHDTGVYAPSHQSFLDHDWHFEWSADYLTEEGIYLKNPMGGSDVFVLPSSPMDLSFETDGLMESVKTPVGDFPQAIQVRNTLIMSVSLTLAGGGTSGTLEIGTLQWYEPYVGLVRAEIDSASLRTQGVELPVPMESVVELTGFTPGE